MFVVFDFDGTLCDITHRRHFVNGTGPKNYDKFFEACVNDVPKTDVIGSLIAHVMCGDTVEIWSGRSDQVRKESEAWLDMWIGDIELPSLYEDYSPTYIKASSLLKRMRPAKDHQPDQELKRKWLHESIAEGKRPAIIFDDRKRVVDMWRSEGITCAQVDPGDFDNDREFKRPGKSVLNIMIGASGSGKSTLIREEIGDMMVVASDDVRLRQFKSDTGISPEAYTPAGFAATFATAHALVKACVHGGIDVIYDATNLRRADRISLLKNVGIIDSSGQLTSLSQDVRVNYFVAERPLEEKLKSFKDNPEWKTNEDIIRKHDTLWNSVRKDVMKADGYPFHVFTTADLALKGKSE